jgi:GPH family glycoside/pentoside/hexuronide:cation symporter
MIQPDRRTLADFAMNNSSPSSIAPLEKLTLSTKLAYGAGDLGAAITSNVLTFYLLFFFTEVAQLPVGLAGSILLVSKIWDAVNDPIVGVMSDNTRSTWGRRYPWMLWGAIPFGLTYILQWIVPTSDPTGLFWYYILVSILFNTAFTVVNLPYTALTPELTQDYHDRTSLTSFRFAFSIGGSMVSIILVLVVSQLVQDPAQRYFVVGVLCAVVSVVSIYWCVYGTRRRAMAMRSRLAPLSETPIPLPEQLRIAFSNRAFLFVIGIYLCSWLALQITATILKYFVISHMGLSDQVSNLVILAVQGTALVMLFFWSAISRRVGKKVTYYWGMGIWIVAQAGLFLLQPGQVGLMYVLAVLAGMGVSTAYLIPWSMLPDVIELDELQTGHRREGVFYSFMVLLQKVGLAAGLFLVAQVLEWSGYISGKVEQSPAALLAIRLAIGPIATLALIAGLVLAYFYPITQAVHAEILLKLQERKQQKVEP